MQLEKSSGQETMLKAIIIDDDIVSRQLISEIVKHYCAEIEILAEADSIYTGVQAIQKFSPDLIFLDIELPDGKGFDLLNLTCDYSFKVIFITAFKEHECNAMKFNPVDYLVKPITPCNIITAVQKIYYTDVTFKLNNTRKIMEQTTFSSDKVMIKTDSNIFLRHPDQIIRLESGKSHTRVVLKDEKPLFSTQSLKSFEARLTSPSFLRIHSSHIINTNYIQYFDKVERYLIMADYSKVPVALRKRELFMDLVS
jgi:two-component system LytT family response regulator